MWQPAHIDGCTVIILEERRGFFGGYVPVESGRLSFDGSDLRLISDQQDRPVTDEELQSFLLVTEASRIAACQGFDLFSIRLSASAV